MRFQYIFTLLSLPSIAWAHTQESPDTCVHLDEVVVSGVTGKTSARQSPAPINVISAEALRIHPSGNIIDAISRVPGVNQITTGSGISKPVIRGLSHNQVLVINDGVRQEGQQWGDEHGIEIDARSVHSIEVLKGPASLMYGSDAMGGVILMHSAPILPEGTMQGEAAAEFQSNNGLLGGTLNWRGNKHGFLWDARSFSAGWLCGWHRIP